MGATKNEFIRNRQLDSDDYEGIEISEKNKITNNLKN